MTPHSPIEVSSNSPAFPLVVLSILTFAGCGLIAVLAAQVGVMHRWVSVLLCVPAAFTVRAGWQLGSEWWRGRHSLFEKLAGTTLLFTLLSHFFGVLLPEVGFDALWYHLPLIRHYTDLHQLRVHPDFYQSFYPQLGDLLFALGYQIWGVLGVKLLAYWSGILLLMLCYSWLKESCTRVWATIITSAIALFQVVSWQMSSGYVDVISSLWLVSVCWLLLGKFGLRGRETGLHWSAGTRWLLASFFFACFLATKFINLGFVPLIGSVLLYVLWSMQASLAQKLKVVLISFVIFGVIAGYWFMRSLMLTGNLLYPMGSEFAEPVVAQMQVGGWAEWLSVRLWTVYRLPIDFFLTNREYMTPLLPLFLILVFYLVKRSVKIARWQWLSLLIGGYGLFFWWFFPPPSTRYVLGQTIVGFIGAATVVARYFPQFPRRLQYAVTGLIVLSLLAPLILRLRVNTRGIPYLLGLETQQEYLDRFRNDFTDEKMTAWYGQ